MRLHLGGYQREKRRGSSQNHRDMGKHGDHHRGGRYELSLQKMTPKNDNLFFVRMIVGERGMCLNTYIFDIFIFLQVGGPVSKTVNNKLIWNLRNGQHVQEESNCKVRQFGPNTLNFTCFKMPLIYKMVFKNTKTDIS